MLSITNSLYTAVIKLEGQVQNSQNNQGDIRKNLADQNKTKRRLKDKIKKYKDVINNYSKVEQENKEKITELQSMYDELVKKQEILVEDCNNKVKNTVTFYQDEIEELCHQHCEAISEKEDRIEMLEKKVLQYRKIYRERSEEEFKKGESESYSKVDYGELRNDSSICDLSREILDQD